MAFESQADTATFKNFLDQVYHDKIIDDTYPQRPPAPKADSITADNVPTTDDSSSSSSSSVSSWLDRPTSLSPNSGPIDYVNVAVNSNNPNGDGQTSSAGESAAAKTEVTRASTSTAPSTAADHLGAQRALMADTGSMSALLPELLIQCDTNHDRQLDKAEIAAGLKKTDLPNAQFELLNIFDKGFDVIHRKEDHDSNPGINKFDMEVLNRAMNSKLGTDPIYGHDAINSIPKAAASGLMASLYVAKKMDPKDRWLAVGIMTVGSVLAQEAILGLNHLFHGNDGKYDEVRKNYLAFQSSYPLGGQHKPLAPNPHTW